MIESRGILAAMHLAVRVLVLLALACASASAQVRRHKPVGFQAHMSTVDWLRLPPKVGERCVQFSSYDRTSNAGPTSGEKWYANADRGNYLRVEQRDGRQEYVMVDIDGPGCLARLWSANPTGTLFFDIDGKRAWTVDFAALCKGEVAGAPDPLAGMRARGGNVYLPITFQKHLTISADQGDLYYLADVALSAPSARVLPFALDVLNGIAMGRQLASGGPFDDQDRASRSTSLQCSTSNPEVAKVQAGQMIDYLGVDVKVPNGGDVDLGKALRNVLLVVRCGNEDTVRVPVCDFFAGGSSWRPWTGYLMGIKESGSAYCCWPMPMPDGGHVALQVVGPLQGVTVSLRGSTKGVGLLFTTPLLFRADYHQVKQQPTRPFSDHLVLNASGKGRFVGCSLLVRNPSRIWWGEGDEKFYVDGETFPSWFGTGTEDYFGYAWCDPTPFSAPFHAQVQCDGPMNFGFTQLHRSHVLDSVPFQTSFRFELERWHWVPDIKIDYATVAYWYGEVGATSGLPTLPSARDRQLEPLPPIKVFEAKGAIEGESLEVRSCSSGIHEIQDLSFFERVFSRDAHRWWRDGKVGDAMVLALPVAIAGSYKVTLAMTRADDFGKVQVTLGGNQLGEPFDGYAPKVSTSGPFVAGTIDLTAGTHDLRFELVGKNPKAKDRMMVGLDYLILEKL